MSRRFRKRLQLVSVLLLFGAASVAVRAAPDDAPDAQLQELVAEAVLNSPEIRAAGNERRAAEHRVAPAGALDDPVLEAGVINTPLTSLRSNREDMSMKMLGLSQKFPFPGKRDLRRDVAAKDAESVAHGYHETVNRVIRDVRIGYFELALIAESVRLVESNRQGLEQFLKISESRYALGQGNQADVLKAQTLLSRMADELLRLGRERLTIEAELNRALGREADAAAPKPGTLRIRQVQLEWEALRQGALGERPLLLGLRSLIERGAKSLDLVRRDDYPDFELKLVYGKRENMPDGLRRDDLLSFSVAINLPVWRENKRDPRVLESIAMRDQATDLYRVQLNELLSKLRLQVASAEQSRQSARLYETSVLPQARLAIESSLAAYRVSRVDFLTLIDNQMTGFNYEIAYASAQAGYNKALAEIDLLTGKPMLACNAPPSSGPSSRCALPGNRQPESWRVQ